MTYRLENISITFAVNMFQPKQNKVFVIHVIHVRYFLKCQNVNSIWEINLRIWELSGLHIVLILKES